MPARTDLTDALIALIPEDGSRISNSEIQAALQLEAGEPISEAELKEIKALVVAMGAAESVKGPGGGLKAPGVAPPARVGASATGTRIRRNGTGGTAPSPQGAIAPGTTAASVLTGELRNQIDRIWDAFWSGGIANPLEVLEQLTYLLFIRRLDELETLRSAAVSALVSRCAAASSRKSDSSCAGAASRNWGIQPRCTRWWASRCSRSCGS